MKNIQGYRQRMRQLEFKNLPFPPTVNKMYAGYPRRYKTSEAKVFETAVDMWFVKNRSLVLEARKSVRAALLDSETFLRVSLDLIIPRAFLFTKKGNVKKVDASNRIKATLDQLANLLNVDDNRFFLGSVEFLIGDEKAVNIMLMETRIKAVNDGKKESEQKKESD